MSYPRPMLMVMVKTAMACLQCGHRAFQWHGRCPQCGAWDSFTQDRGPGGGSAPPRPLAQIGLAERARLLTGVGELDRVLGGGLVAGSIVLLAGEPGVGKSTLMLQAAAGLERAGRRVLLACGEESLEQVAARAGRVGGVEATCATSATELSDVLAAMGGADAAIVDSIQTMRDPEVSGGAGSVVQVRSCAGALARHARASGTAVVLVGHVTKDGSVAGPRVLEHLVDAVLTFEGDRGHALRTIRATKNRFGATAEVGLFEMGPLGLQEVPDASSLLLGDRNPGIAGSAVGCVLEGRRPLVLEVQTLVVETGAALARRVASGIEATRLGVVLAVLDRRAGVLLSKHDVYASVAGGFRVAEPGIDLALALALASARLERPIPQDLAAVGELGLGGEIRTVPGLERRLAEIARLGFRRVIVPRSSPTAPRGTEAHPVPDLAEALKVLE